MSHSAVAYRENASLDRLTEVIQTPTRKPGKGELLVKIYSCALNPTDWKHFAGQWGEKGCILGTDSSGVVVEVGSDVTEFKKGDYVSSFSHGGYKKDPFAGSFQEYAIVEASTTLKYPHLKSVNEGDVIDSFDKAAAVNLGLATIGMTFAYQFNWEFNDPSLKKEWVLICGGASATGLLAIQVAKKIYGLNVITTASTQHNQLLKSLGADVIVDYKSPEALEAIRKATNNNLKYALDTVSDKSTFNLANEALKESGEAYLDNLLALDDKSLDHIKQNVNVSGTLVYLVHGKDQDLNGFVVKADQKIVERHTQYWKHIQEYVLNGVIKSQPLTILPNGFESVNEGLYNLQNGVHATKLIFKVIN